MERTLCFSWPISKTVLSQPQQLCLSPFSPNPRPLVFNLGYQGNIDFPLGQGIQSLPVSIQGWAAIPGSNKGTGVGAVEIWNGPRESGQFLTEAIYGIYRSDVAEALGDPRFASSGFTAQLSNLPAGPVDIHVYVRDRESGDYVSPRLGQSPLSRRIYLAEGKVADAAWPVALAPAPDGRLFFAELLTGNIRIVQEGKVRSEPFATIEKVSTYGESGFLGLALHPNFPREPYVYAMYVVDNPDTGFPLMQRVVRYRDDEGTGRDPTVILDNLPAATVYFHNGGRIAFGPMGNSIFQLAIPMCRSSLKTPVGWKGPSSATIPMAASLVTIPFRFTRLRHRTAQCLRPRLPTRYGLTLCHRERPWRL